MRLSLKVSASLTLHTDSLITLLTLLIWTRWTHLSWKTGGEHKPQDSTSSTKDNRRLLVSRSVSMGLLSNYSKFTIGPTASLGGLPETLALWVTVCPRRTGTARRAMVLRSSGILLCKREEVFSTEGAGLREQEVD